MKSFVKTKSIANTARCFSANQSGATLIEFAVVLPLFLLIFFGLLDFGRLAFHYVTAEKAMQTAVRLAAVRPAACAGVPEIFTRGSTLPGVIPPKFGTNCSAGPSICFNPGTITCSGLSTNPTAAEIWPRVAPTLPNDATIANLLFTYSYDSNLGFLGGPYVPVVTVEIQRLNFDFISPLSALLGLAGGAAIPGLGASIPFPSMSSSMPAEDLASGNNG
jgi:hypothetical protein